MNSNYTEDDKLLEINILDIFSAILRKIKSIIAFMVAFGIAAFLISNYVITPKYIANISMCISNGSNGTSIDYNDVNASITLVPTYVELMSSANVLEEVAAKTQDLGYTVEEIGSMINITAKTETQVILVSVTNSDPAHANIIANAIADIAPDKIVSFMEGTTIRVIDKSVQPDRPASPNVKKNTMLGFLGGGFLGVLLAVLLEIMDKSIKSADHLNTLYPDIPVLGVIPEFTAGSENYEDKNNEKN